MRRALLLAALMVMVFVSVSHAEVKTYTMTVRQLFGGGQSPDSATVSAVTKAKREALEQAGTYIESMTLVRDSAVAVDEIFALAAGLLKTEIVTRKNIMEGNLFGIEVTARVDVDTAVMEMRVKALLADRGSLEEIKQATTRIEKSQEKMSLSLDKISKGFEELARRGGINRIYYGIDKENPDKEFNFPPHKGAGTASITEDVPVYVEVPSGVKFVTVRVVYFDQTRSDVVKFAKSE